MSTEDHRSLHWFSTWDGLWIIQQTWQITLLSVNSQMSPCASEVKAFDTLAPESPQIFRNLPKYISISNNHLRWGFFFFGAHPLRSHASPRLRYDEWLTHVPKIQAWRVDRICSTKSDTSILKLLPLKNTTAETRSMRSIYIYIYIFSHLLMKANTSVHAERWLWKASFLSVRERQGGSWSTALLQRWVKCHSSIMHTPDELLRD